MTNEKEKPTRYDLIEKLQSIFDQLELAKEKEAQSLKEGSERASNKLVLELWSRFLQLVEEAKGTTQDLMSLNPQSSLDEALECLQRLSSCAYDSIQQSPEKDVVLILNGSIQTFAEKQSVLLKKLKCLSRRLGRYYWRRVLSKYLWTIACTLERYALDAIEDEDPSSVYSFSDPVVGVERPMNSLLEYITRAENVSKWVSHLLAKEALNVLAELRQQLSNVKNRIMKSIAIGGHLGSSLLSAKRVMHNSFRAMNKNYYGRLKDLSIEFKCADGFGQIEINPTDTIGDKAQHASYWWTRPLTEDYIEHIEARYGALADTLPELAELIREADRNSISGSDTVGTHELALWDSLDIDQIPDFKALSQDTYKAVIRAHASARKLRPKIEMVVGPEQAARFYDDLREALAFDRTHHPKGWKWAGGAGKAEGIARSVEQWHRLLLLLTKPDAAASKQKTAHVEKSQAENVFKKTGDFWTVKFQGETKPIPHSIGFAYIRLLLNKQSETFTTAEFLSLCSNKHVTLAGGDDQLDDEAKESYKNRLADIEYLLEEAKNNNDSGTQEKLEGEKDEIIAELSKAVGFGKHSKKLTPEYDKYRLSIGNAIVRAIEKIEKCIPELARHFRDAVPNPYSNTSLSYRPAEPIDWEL